MKTVLIVGGSLKSFREYLVINGYDHITLSDSQQSKATQSVSKRRIVCDFSDRQDLSRTLADLKNRVDAVTVTYENYILPAAEIAKSLGLPALPVESAMMCTDKQLMRQAFSKAPMPISPDFQVIKSRQDLAKFAETHSFPLIIKPANLAKSLLVTKSGSLDELLANYDRTQEQISEVYGRYAPNRQPKIIVEEFMEGSIHSVDAFVDSYGVTHVLDQIVDYQTGYDIGYDDNFHYSRVLPSQLKPRLQDELREVARLGCRALGMKNTPAHIEIIMTKSGPKIVEIGARNGGYRERMHRLANGLDITKLQLDLAFGKQIALETKRDDSCAVLELFPKNNGAFSGIANVNKLKLLDSFNYLSIKAKPGQFVGKAGDGYKMCAVVILHNDDAQQFKNDLEYTNNSVFVETR